MVTLKSVFCLICRLHELTERSDEASAFVGVLTDNNI